MNIADQWLETTKRYEARTSERSGTEARIASGAIFAADTPERVGLRLMRKGIDPDTVTRVLSGAPPLAGEAVSPRVFTTLERIMGKDNLISAAFLTEGARVSRAVCRIEICEPNGLIGGYGTGVMISSLLMLTNNHVLGSPETAAASLAEFGYEEDDLGRLRPSVRFALDPGALFATNPELDFTVVAVCPESADGQALCEFGSVPLLERPAKAIKGECVNIIQHPNGEPKRLALRENTIVDLLDNFMHYKTDTAPGSSGSPVFNDEWEMVALHHSGVPAKDADGNLLAVDGGVWDPVMGEHRVKWVANEGVRVSRIIASLREHALSETQQQLLSEAIVANGSEPVPGASPELPKEPPRPRTLGAAASGEAEAVAAEPIADSDVMIWTIPIQVSARLGTPLGAPVVLASRALPTELSALTPIAAPRPDREWASSFVRRRGRP